MKKLSIYLALVAGWASTQPAALKNVGSVMRQANRTLTAQAGLGARALTRTIVQPVTIAPAVTFTRCNHSNNQQSNTFKNIKIGLGIIATVTALSHLDINSMSNDTLHTLLSILPEFDAKTAWIMQHLTKADINSMSNETLRILLGNLPESKRHLLKEELKEKLIEKNLVLKTLFDPTLKDQGPLFCETFNNNNFDKFLDHSWCVFHELLPLISEYVAEEYRQNRIVFFHGQSSVWPLLTDIYIQLTSLTSGQDFLEDFIPLRFTTQATLTKKDVAYLTQQGVESTPHRPNLLFVNLHLFSNGGGSNSFRYVTNNSDQSTNHDRADFITHVTAIFKEAGCQAELPLLEKELFELKGLYDAAIQEQGNKGTLLVISMPPGIASEIAYSAGPGGFINPITIKGKPTTDPTVIAKTYDEVPFNNEYCICLNQQMLDPKKAQQAGIK